MRYTVNFKRTETVSVDVTVTANSEDEAVELVKAGQYRPEDEYIFSGSQEIIDEGWFDVVGAEGE